MFCHQCGRQIGESSKFCHYCGANLQSFSRQNINQPQHVGNQRSSPNHQPLGGNQGTNLDKNQPSVGNEGSNPNHQEFIGNQGPNQNQHPPFVRNQEFNPNHHQQFVGNQGHNLNQHQEFVNNQSPNPNRQQPFIGNQQPNENPSPNQQHPNVQTPWSQQNFYKTPPQAEGSNFYPTHPQYDNQNWQQYQQADPITLEDITKSVKGTFQTATEKINKMVGEQGHLKVNLKDVFSDVFKHHTKEEAERLFISGTSLTTPKEHEISITWPKPWLFSRVLLVMILTYILLFISTYMFKNMNAFPGLIMIGSFAAPFSLLIFFWEMNAPRNISIYEVAKMFFVGGAASLVTTLFLYEFFPVNELDFTGAIIVGAVEEIGKLVIIILFVYRLNAKYILNGLLIGAAIGAGFGAFESAGYAFNIGLWMGDSLMLSTIFNRAWMSIGTHVVWSAIAGAALVFVKSAQPLNSKHVFNGKFLQLFAVPFILHAVWDMPLYSLHTFYFLFIVLIVVAWVFVLVLISKGLKQLAPGYRFESFVSPPQQQSDGFYQ